MPTKRLVLAQPASDGTNEFPFVDVRLGFADALTGKSGSSLSGGFIVRFYRVKAAGARVFKAQAFTTEERILTTPNRIRDPGVNENRTRLFNFFDIIYIATTPNLQVLYSVDPDVIRDMSEAENSFESLKINDPIPFYMMVECLKILLEREGDPDFAGLTIVEDAE